MSVITSLTDKDRIFTNLYGYQPWTLQAARQRGDANMGVQPVQRLADRRAAHPELRPDLDEGERAALRKSAETIAGLKGAIDSA